MMEYILRLSSIIDSVRTIGSGTNLYLNYSELYRRHVEVFIGGLNLFNTYSEELMITESLIDNLVIIGSFVESISRLNRRFLLGVTNITIQSLLIQSFLVYLLL